MKITTKRTQFMVRLILLIAGLLITSPLATLATEVTATAKGYLEIDNPPVIFKPGYYTEKWSYGNTVIDYSKIKEEGPIQFSMNPFGKKEIDGSATITKTDGAIKAEYTFKAKTEITLNSLLVGATLSLDDFAGGSWKCNDKSGVFPKEYKDLFVMHGHTRSIMITAADGRTIRIMFPEETRVLIQDNRRWTESYTLRIGHLSKLALKKDESRSINFSIILQAPTILNREKPITIEAGADWTPLKVELDIEKGSALDFSQLGFTDAPAGKYGRVITKGPHFVFEKMPDKPQRFYGVNFCFSANYLEKETAEMIAKRLARIGYNSIRIHHHDNTMVSGSPDATDLNKEEMRKFDNFTAACIKEGLYISTDLYVSRRVPWKAIGIDKPGSISQTEFKKLVPVHEGAYNNLKKYVTNWMTHVNPNTGRSYAQEPALAWINLLNEANFGNYYSEIKNIPEWTTAWQKWLTEKKRLEPDKYKSIPDFVPENGELSKDDPHCAAFLLFFRDLEIDMVNKFRSFLQDELGCKALITNANGWSHFLPDHFTRAKTYDYIDDHFYVDHPHFLQKKWSLPSRCPNTNPVKSISYGGRREIYMRHFDKPFTITEYNFSAPGRFRGVGGILTGTMAALQDWSGLWRFAYSHNGNSLARGTAPTIGYFDMLNDPLSLAAERASICLFLRQDIAPLQKSAVIYLPEEKFNSLDNRYYKSKNLWHALGWSRKTGVQVGGPKPQGYTHTASYPEVFEQYIEDKTVIPFIGSDIDTLVKENKALTIDNKSGTFVITTDRTCGGFTEKGTIKAGVLSADISESAATVWVSSVDKKPLAKSRRMILTHLTDIQNTGIKYAGEKRQILLKWGGLPHVVRNGKAKITLKAESPEKYKVYALTTGGRRVAAISTSVSNGLLCFEAKTTGLNNNAVIIYEIVRE
ncbi:MAG: hypothetical protein PF904_18295 [Kiritimatiellae bacterium]|nr:hypothetical protein [Kiritimatiellia bacterium]